MNIETNKKKKQIAILGSTGSIGTQALQVIEEHPDLYEAYALTANNRVELLIAQARKFQPEVVVIANEEKYSELKEALSDLPIKVYAGTDAICQIVEAGPIDISAFQRVSGSKFQEVPGSGLLLPLRSPLPRKTLPPRFLPEYKPEAVSSAERSKWKRSSYQQKVPHRPLQYT